MTRASARQTERGYSLTEALIALSILSAGLFTLAQFQAEMQAYTGDTKTQTTALHLAEQKLEELRTRCKQTGLTIADGTDRPTSHAGDSAAFTRNWAVSSHSSPSYLEVQVATSWQSREGDARQVSLSSILATTAPYRQSP